MDGISRTKEPAMKNVNSKDIAILLAAVENSDQVCPLSPAQMRALRGGRATTLSEYCDTAMMIIQNNDLTGNSGTQVYWDKCFAYWDAKY
jgi:hypothetical protein